MLAAIIGVVSAILMYGVYTFNRRLAAQVKVPHCLLLPKTIASDAWTSIGTAIAIFAASFGWGWLDSLTAIVVAVLILKRPLIFLKKVPSHCQMVLIKHWSMSTNKS